MLHIIKQKLRNDIILSDDIDFDSDFILPYSKAENISAVRLVIIGQDPTIQCKTTSKQRQRKITTTLDLDNESGNLRKYCKLICEAFNLDIDKDVYATNLCKCVFKEKPAYNGVLEKHSKLWRDPLKEELSVFSNSVIFVTLGQPLIKQLIRSNQTKVSYYWDYKGKTESGLGFKCCEPTQNYLQKRIYPLAHQPTWKRNKFYNKYLSDYLKYISDNERMTISSVNNT
jgi:uracil-DNA glycosylase